MNPGRLRESITVQERSDNAAGQYRSPERAEAPWTEDFKDKADVSLDNQKTDLVGGKDSPKQRATFIVRRRSEYLSANITQKRIVWRGQAFEIQATAPFDTQRRWLKVATVFKGEVP